MFHLLSAVWHRYFVQEEYKVLILGPDGAGKTTLLEAIKAECNKSGSSSSSMPARAIVPTVGLNLAHVCHADTKLLWDLGGRPCLRSIWAKYYKNTQGIILVVDASVPQKDGADRWCDARGIMREVLEHPQLRYVPILIVENKSDVISACNSDEEGDVTEGGDGEESRRRRVGSTLGIESAFEGIDHPGEWDVACDVDLTHTHGYGRWVYRVVRCSAVTGAGVRDALNWICAVLKLNRRVLDRTE
eukprot:PhM_4_TR3740/c0_g1_i1/m.55836/K07952/ARFRP1; ADP-ribosylation factor related protein 1